MAQRVNIWRIAQELDNQLNDMPDLRAELMMMVDHEPMHLLPWLDVIEQATDVTGSLTQAISWLKAPTSALDGARPVALLHEPDGPERAQQILTKMQEKLPK